MSRSEWRGYAEKYKGVPYVWGGTTAKGGMDCSGFVYRVLRDMGFNIVRHTAQSFYNAYKGNKTTIANAKQGDLLFFGKSTSKITHIAFYSKSNQMLESGGGGSANTSLANAGVGVRYRNIRTDLVAVVNFNYGDSINTSTGGGEMYFQVGLLQKGMYDSPDVLLFEEIMKARGIYKGNLDWAYGSQCVQACKDYQALRNKETGNSKFLVVDGECGEKTWADLLGLPRK